MALGARRGAGRPVRVGVGAGRPGRSAVAGAARRIEPGAGAGPGRAASTEGERQRARSRPAVAADPHGPSTCRPPVYNARPAVGVDPLRARCVPRMAGISRLDRPTGRSSMGVHRHVVRSPVRLRSCHAPRPATGDRAAGRRRPTLPDAGRDPPGPWPGREVTSGGVTLHVRETPGPDGVPARLRARPVRLGDELDRPGRAAAHPGRRARPSTCRVSGCPGRSRRATTRRPGTPTRCCASWPAAAARCTCWATRWAARSRWPWPPAARSWCARSPWSRRRCRTAGRTRGGCRIRGCCWPCCRGSASGPAPSWPR